VRAPDAVTRWRQLRDAIDAAIQQADAVKLPPETRATLQKFIAAVVVTYTYPRALALRGMFQMVRAPFTVHYETGRICVPIDPTTMDTVDVDRLPKVQSLVDGTATLDPYLDYFKRFVDGCCARAAAADSAAPITVPPPPPPT